MGSATLPRSVLYDRTLSVNALRYYDLISEDPKIDVPTAAQKLGVTLSAAYKLERTLIKRGHLTITTIYDSAGERRIRNFAERQIAS